MMNKLKPTAENENVAIYVGKRRELRGLQENAARPEIYVVLDRSMKDFPLEKFPNKTVNEVIDYLVSRNDSWEGLPELNQGLTLTRQEAVLLNGTDDKILAGQHSNGESTMVAAQGHIRPRFYAFLQSFSNIEKYVKEPIIPYKGKSEPSISFGGLENMELGRSWWEYAALEDFCDLRLGPSFVKQREYDGLSEKLLQSTTEEGAIDTLKEIGRLQKDDLSDSTTAWWGLNVLFQNLKDRIARVQEYQENWFPGEIIKGRKSYEDTRTWLNSLKDGGVELEKN